MQDLTIELPNRPGALAEMGEALGRAGVSVEGGGAWVHDGTGIGHFLVQDAAAARAALEAQGVRVLQARDVLIQRLNQDEPGQLGKLTRRMADAGVNIDTLYSDHDHRLILCVDDTAGGMQVSEAWEEQRRARSEARPKHHYAVSIQWTGNEGEGTRNYRSYRRDHTIAAGDKPVIQASSDPAFRGDPARYNPEELFVAALSSCHMLTYLHLCAVNGVVVSSYADDAAGIMQEDGKTSGSFSSVTLRPRVTVTQSDMMERAGSLHHEAHALCFLARSVAFPIHVEPEIQVA